MKILVINAGSSTIKFNLVSMPDQKSISSGMVERIGSDKSTFHFRTDINTVEEVMDIKNHNVALEIILDALMNEFGTIKSTDEIDLVAHRVVHGGHVFNTPIIINSEIKNIIKDFEIFAPLHNPKNLEAIELCENLFPTARQIAVFDTSFHTTIPEHARQYAIPSMLAAFDDVTKCGFHGISHRYVSQYAINNFNLANSKIISLHLGSGCSAAAIQDGKSVETSMGISTGGGLIMSTRCGDIDHAIIFYLVNRMNYSLAEAEDLLNNESGLLGLTGYTDYRDILHECNRGDESCQLALAMTAYRIRQYVGAYAATMNGVDAIIFTAGIGENAAQLRKDVCIGLSHLGVNLEDASNESTSTAPRVISTNGSPVEVLVIPTNEALEIAQEAYNLII